MTNALRRALAFDRAIRVRGAERSFPAPLGAPGVVIRHDALRSKHTLNCVLLDAPLRLSAQQIARVADEGLADLPHRCVVIDDAQAGEQIAVVLAPHGWTRQRLVWMALRREPDRPPASELARPIDEAVLRRHQLAAALEERGRTSALELSLARILTAGQAALRAGTPWLAFGAARRPDGPIESTCTLFLDPGGLALIDEVGTLEAARGRGLARAVVSAAIEAARAEGCSDLVIPAELDDWPRLLYERIGFDEIGRQVALMRVP